MKFLVLFISLSSVFSTLCQSDTSKKKINPEKIQIAGVYKNSISLNAGGTSGTGGISWEHLLSKRWMMDIGIGFPGAGAGIKFFPWPVKRGKVRIHLNGLTNFMAWPGGSGFQQFYGGAGFSWFLVKKFNLALDFGPGYFYHYWFAPGKFFPDRWFLMGNFKMGWRFSFYAMKRRQSYFDKI